jgi:hypothetical protein
LLDPGQPPRRKLRYAWNASRKEQLAMDLRTSGATEVGGAKASEVPLPPVHVTLAIDPRSVSPEGDLAYDWRVTGTSVASGPEFPPQVADGMRVEVSAVEHLRGSAIVTSRGLARDVVIEPGSVVDAGAGQMVEQLRQTLRDVAAPLPDEEVGRGARWQKLSQLDAKETRITQTETFTLSEVHAAPGQPQRGVLDDVLAQTAPSQPLRSPGVPQAEAPRMESMLASGSGVIRFDLSRLVPQSQFDGTTTMVVSGQAPGDPARHVTIVMRVGISIQGTTH